MAKILFVAFNHTKTYALQGTYLTVATISSLVKQHGHQAHLVEITSPDDGPRRVLEHVERWHPDVVGFSVMTGDYTVAVGIARRLRRCSEAKVLFGGIHVIINPEEVIRERSIDFACVGEGEYPTLELLDRLDRREPLDEIKNLWHKLDDRVVRSPLRPLNDLDALPPPDVDLFDERHQKKVYYTMTSAGCPYDCSYCYSHRINERYRGLGKRVRRKSVPKIVDEVAAVARRRGIERVSFLDDAFSLDRRWVLDFCREYKQRVGLPFYVMTHVESVDEEVVTALHGAGCCRLWFGIESGSERIRHEILNKQTTNQEIEGAIALVRRAGIDVGAFFMIGLPDEDRGALEETYALARRLRLDCISVSMAMPYKGTRLWQICKDRGLLVDEELPGTFRTPLTNLAFSREHKRRLRRYYYKLYNLNTYKNYVFLIKHRALIPAYRLTKLLVNDERIEQTYHVLRKLKEWLGYGASRNLSAR